MSVPDSSVPDSSVPDSTHDDIQQLIKCARENDVDGCKRIIEKGVDVNAKGLDVNQFGGKWIGEKWFKSVTYSALHIAALNSAKDVVKVLLETPGVVVDIRGFAGWTPLHKACWNITMHSTSIVRALLMAGADVNARGSCDKTPLHLACTHGSANLDVISCLLEYGADPNATDSEGLTPMAFVDKPKQRAIRRLLVSYGASNIYLQKKASRLQERADEFAKRAESLNEKINFLKRRDEQLKAKRLVYSAMKESAEKIKALIESSDLPPKTLATMTKISSKHLDAIAKLGKKRPRE